MKSSVLWDMWKDFLFNKEYQRHSGGFFNKDLKITGTQNASYLNFSFWTILQFHLWTFDYVKYNLHKFKAFSFETGGALFLFLLVPTETVIMWRCDWGGDML